MSALLEGKVSVVTGGAQGIGLAVAERLAVEGSRVMIGDVRHDEAERQAERLRSAGLDVRAAILDVTDPVSVARAAEECATELGEIDVLVANAGILRLGPALDMDLATWRSVIDVNLTGVFVCCQEFARRMVRRGRGGRIVVMSSLFGRRGGRDN